MQETPRHSELTREPGSPGSQDAVDRFWAHETERRRSRRRGWLATAVGSWGAIGTLVLLGGVSPHIDYTTYLAMLGAASASGASSAWLTFRGITGLWNSRPPAPPARRPAPGAIRRSSSEKEVERQVLEMLQHHGEVTPARVALETALTVDEAQRKLSELAEKGHLDVRVEGSKLVYSL